MILKNRHKEILLNIAQHNIQTPINIWAFGSRVNGDACNGSDLDLIIRTKDDKPLDFQEFVNFKEGLTESNIPFLVDVLDWNRIPDYFKENISKKYEVLKEL
ncbi:MAG: nucleotidyltransferase domain-containing protein [Gammaproteobacteria bacterium]|nr:nucleotidyltransferase domain-containing protein [Gammaproteobacteria bacterium]